MADAALNRDEDLFDTLARPLVRAGLYVSYADGEQTRTGAPGKGSDLEAEAKALRGVFEQLAAKDDGFAARIGQSALRALGSFPLPQSAAEAAARKQDFETAPQEIKLACAAALAALTLEDAKRYTDMILAVCATVAQAYDEGSVSSSMDRFFDFVTLLEGRPADYLADLNGVLSDAKISAKEDAAINKIGAQMHAAWIAAGQQ